MTNGEKIKEIFPTFEFIEETEKDRTPQHQFLKVYGINKMPYMEFDLGWWNAEYKEPTTNDLGVDCIVDILGGYTDLDIPYMREIAENILTKLSSVTPQPCEDAVSRKAVINQIFYSTDNNGDVVLGSALRERIARLPSVTPQYSSGLEKNSKLEKIRDQLKSNLRGVEIALEVLVENDPLMPKMEGAKTTLEDCLELIDKAEAESI